MCHVALAGKHTSYQDMYLWSLIHYCTSEIIVPQRLLSLRHYCPSDIIVPQRLLSLRHHCPSDIIVPQTLLSLINHRPSPLVRSPSHFNGSQTLVTWRPHFIVPHPWSHSPIDITQSTHHLVSLIPQCHWPSTNEDGPIPLAHNQPIRIQQLISCAHLGYINP